MLNVFWIFKILGLVRAGRIAWVAPGDGLLDLAQELAVLRKASIDCVINLR